MQHLHRDTIWGNRLPQRRLSLRIHPVLLSVIFALLSTLLSVQWI